MVCLCSVLLFLMFFASRNVVAAENMNAPANNVNVNVPEEAKTFDKLVSVQNNQYVLLQDTTQVLSAKQYHMLLDQLSNINQLVVTDHDIIDPTTKSFDYGISSRTDNPTYKGFWWGTRYYFTSNAQVDTMVYDLNSAANARYSFGGIPIVGALLTWDGARLSQAALDLNRYNQLHIHDHIYMDLNTWLGSTSFGTF